MDKIEVGVIGSGTMGIGIAQVAAMAGHQVVLYDIVEAALQKASEQLQSQLNRLAEKGKISNAEAVGFFGNIYFSNSISSCSNCKLIIEAVKEDLNIKKELFIELEKIIPEKCILASNTSSLSITSLAAVVKNPQQFIGIHFFNPASIMPLVEIIPALQTNQNITNQIFELISSWGKITVIAKDTPGFIVNRIARPYYSEAIRIYEEGFADFATIDYAMTCNYGFKMGPFELMDFIGNDVNYMVTKSIWEACFFEPRYKPSITQRNLLNANWLGKKTGRGYYDYALEKTNKPIFENTQLVKDIAWRILLMLINEAADALYYKMASREDIELAMTKGVNYPKGLLAWAEEIGIDHCISTMDRLFDHYKEERYRCSLGLRLLKDSK